MYSSPPCVLLAYHGMQTGNLFWWIGGFQRNPPIFDPPKLYSVIRNCRFHMYNRLAVRRVSLIVGIEFTIGGCLQGHDVSKQF